VRAADEAEFREYAGARLPWLRRTAFLISGDWHLAEDVASTVLAKVYQRWGKLRRLDNLDAYVRTMLVRAVTDEHRRPWRRETPTDAPAELGPVGGRQTLGAPGDLVHDRVVLWDALQRVPSGRRAVLVLRFFEDLSVEETATVLGCSVGTVKSQTARGLDSLRGVLPEDFLQRGSSAASEGGAR
jgi:RNA polymerase sigma-70 factor (sigma-E family)